MKPMTAMTTMTRAIPMPPRVPISKIPMVEDSESTTQTVLLSNICKKKNEIESYYIVAALVQKPLQMLVKMKNSLDAGIQDKSASISIVVGLE